MKMRENKKWTVSLLAVAALTAASCSPPQEAIDGARAALSEAEALEVSSYAPEAWQEAQRAMQAVDDEIALQEEKFALFRSYTRTEELTAAAREAAAAAEEAAMSGREQAKTAAETALADATATVDSAQALLDGLQQCERKPKGFAADVEQLTGMLDGLRSQLPEVGSLLESEDFLGAQTRSEAVLIEANGLLSDFTEAKTKLGC